MGRLTGTAVRLLILASVIATAKTGFAQQLTGAARSALIESTMNSCERGKGMQPATAAVPATAWTEYCRCFGNAVADRVTMNDVKAGPSGLVPIAQAAEKDCAGPLLKSLPKPN